DFPQPATALYPKPAGGHTAGAVRQFSFAFVRLKRWAKPQSEAKAAAVPILKQVTWTKSRMPAGIQVIICVRRVISPLPADMKIVDIRATTVTVPLQAPLRHANGCHWGRF